VKKLVLAASLVAAAASPAHAEYPDRPITFIIPFSVGGGTDIGGRTVAAFLERCLGAKQPVVVVNKPGAGGQIGFAEIARAAPDGYTIGGLNVPNIQIGAITKSNSGYTLDSFDYLGTFYGSRTTLSVQKDSKYTDIQQVIDDAKTEPVQIGISGIGSDDHFFTLKLGQTAGIKLTNIPFGDSAGTSVALLGGHIGIATLNVVTATKYAEAVRVLAVASEQRVAELPDVPTMREKGYDVVSGTTHVLGAPKGLPEEAKSKLTSCFAKIAIDPAFEAEIKKLALIPTPMDSGATATFVMDEYDALKSIWVANPWE
jgi:tripartite-type tricarboxylate transporter receptor subunit TctC